MRAGERDWLEDRIRGCLAFAALGDAAGGPFEGRTREEVRERGDPLAGLRAGQSAVTDDTGQLEALAQALVEERGELTPDAWRAALRVWFLDSPTAARAGPTTRAALEGGPGPGEGGAAARDVRLGATNGSAMRVAPCGLIHPADPASAMELAWLTSRVTHDSPVALGGAGAIAAGVAVALRPGCGVDDMTAECARAAARADARLAERIELAAEEAHAGRDADEALERIEAAVGTSMLAFESVPAAIGVFAAFGDDPLETVRAGVRIGGDTDTIAAMAGALAGALHGFAAQEPDDRSLLELAAPEELLSLAPELAALAAASPP